ncbi:MAG TPA: VanW family protein [Acidimicrobiales bacterium]|nr:VanW family protein [Acidimicrobiales bacterium]
MVVLTAAWAVDSRAHDGRVVRAVVLAGRQVGGMERGELARFVDEVAGRYEQAPIEVRAPGGGFPSDARELGLTVDRAGTVRGVMAEGREGALPARVWDWARHLFGSRPAAVEVQVDRAAVARVVTDKDPARVPPVEPFIAIRDGRLSGVSGRPGQGIEAASVERALTRADLGRVPVVVEVRRGLVPPRFRREDADRVAEQAEQMAAAGFKVQAGPKEATVPPEMLRRWVKAEVAGDALRLAPETGPVAEDLTKLFPAPVVPPVDAGFAVSGRSVSVTPARAGSGCCAPEAVNAVANALTAGPPPAPVDLALKTVPPRRDESSVRRLGIVEQVATFTTPHAAGEPRVRNIHLIADLLRGTVIEPGQTFSVNAAVGPRTREKGFVEAPVIGDSNKFDTSPGGGISQFATTLFNAAFFAGLEIPEYQAHGLYISRYPYGREATLSYPRPDLRVRNNSPHGVLVWPTYTGSSITVSLYSTRWVEEVTQSNQTVADRGPCKAVTTERTRKFPDGRTLVDRFNALYAPEEGVRCT